MKFITEAEMDRQINLFAMEAVTMERDFSDIITSAVVRESMILSEAEVKALPAPETAEKKQSNFEKMIETIGKWIKKAVGWVKDFTTTTWAKITELFKKITDAVKKTVNKASNRFNKQEITFEYDDGIFDAIDNFIDAATSTTEDADNPSTVEEREARASEILSGYKKEGEKITIGEAQKFITRLERSKKKADKLIKEATKGLKKLESKQKTLERKANRKGEEVSAEDMQELNNGRSAFTYQQKSITGLSSALQTLIRDLGTSVIQAGGRNSTGVEESTKARPFLDFSL